MLHIVDELCYNLHIAVNNLTMTTKPLTKFLNVRLSPTDHKVFHKKAGKYGKPSDVLREIIQAFNSERLVIKPPVTVKESLYVTRTQD